MLKVFRQTVLRTDDGHTYLQEAHGLHHSSVQKFLIKGSLKKFFQIFSYYFQKNLEKKRLKGHIVCIYTRNIDF